MKNSGRWEPSLNQKKKNETILEVPSNFAQVAKTSEKILNTLSTLKLDDTDLFNIRLCIEEAVRNAMVHGNKSKKDLPVKISYSLNGDELEISIEDAGEGFDYKNLPDPTKEENITKGSGRGVFLILHLMDKVTFNDKGNIITMVKKLKPRGSSCK